MVVNLIVVMGQVGRCNDLAHGLRAVSNNLNRVIPTRGGAANPASHLLLCAEANSEVLGYLGRLFSDSRAERRFSAASTDSFFTSRRG